MAAAIVLVLVSSVAPQLQAESGPQVVIEPAITRVTLLPGQTTQRLLRIANPGTASLVWTLQYPVLDWLKVPTTSGVTMPGTSTYLTLAFDATGYQPTNIGALLWIYSNAPGLPRPVIADMIVAPPGIVSGATYQLTNVGTRQALDITGGSMGESAAALQWPPHTGPNQRWIITRSSAGYRLEAQHSGKVLSVIGAEFGNYAAVVQQADLGQAHQRWYLEYATAGYHLSAIHSAKLLTVAEGAEHGAPAVQRLDTGSLRQQWVLNIQPDPTLVPGAIYKLVNKHSGKCLDVRTASVDVGANVWTWHDNGTIAQRWRIERNEDGWRLIAQCSGHSLQVPTTAVLGNDVTQGGTSDWPHQRWYAVDTGGGWYKIASASTYDILDVAGAGTADGSDAITQPDSGQDSQRWRIEMITPTTVAAR